MLDKEITVDKIEVQPATGAVQVRQKVAIIEDGVEVSHSYHRYVLAPDADLSNQPEAVADIARAARGSCKAEKEKEKEK